jgi:hypothetical protein
LAGRPQSIQQPELGYIGHAVPSGPKQFLIGLRQGWQIAVEESHRPEGKPWVLPVHFCKCAERLLERNAGRKHGGDVAVVLGFCPIENCLELGSLKRIFQRGDEKDIVALSELLVDPTGIEATKERYFHVPRRHRNEFSSSWIARALRTNSNPFSIRFFSSGSALNKSRSTDVRWPR